MKASKIIGLTAVSIALALSAGCTGKRKARIGSLGIKSITYTDGISGNGYGIGDMYSSSNAGIGNNDGKTYSKSGKPGTGGNNIVYFDYDSTKLSSKSFQKLNKHVTYLKQNGSSSVTVAGHADERGTREYNVALGERRAQSVKDYLITNGVATNQIKTISYGEERPKGTFQQSRRAEVTY